VCAFGTTAAHGQDYKGLSETTGVAEDPASGEERQPRTGESALSTHASIRWIGSGL